MGNKPMKVCVVHEPHLRFCAVKNASTLSPGCTVTYSWVGVNFQGMSSATSAANHTRICTKTDQKHMGGGGSGFTLPTLQRHPPL